MDFGSCLRILQLTAQMVHVDGYRIRFQLLVDSVELFFQDRLWHDSALPPQQVLQDRALATGKLQQKLTNAHVPSNRIQHDIAGLQLDPKRSPGTPQERFGAGDELNSRERLCEVIVCSSIQSRYPVLDRVACGKDQNGNAVMRCSQFCEQVQAVAIGQTEIENRGVIDGDRERLSSVVASVHHIHCKSGALQSGLQYLRNPRLVFYDQ